MLKDIRLIIGDWLLDMALSIYPGGEDRESLALSLINHWKRLYDK